MNKKAYISPVVNAVRVSTTEMLLAYSDPKTQIGEGYEDPDKFDVKDQGLGSSYNVWDEDWTK